LLDSLLQEIKMVTSCTDPIVYISAGCNRTPHCLAWSPRSGLVYYGSHHSVCVYSTTQAKVVRSLVGHTARVNCVRCINTESDLEYIVSGSTDFSVTVWKEDTGNFSKILNYKIHTGAVTNLSSALVDQNLLVVSTSTDSTIKFATVDIHTAAILNEGSIDLGTGVALDMHLLTLPGFSVPLLVVARDDCRLHVYESKNFDWEKVGMLSGHEDWVVSIDSKLDGESLVLVTGSQDNLVRLWRANKSRVKENMNELSVTEEVMLIDDVEWGFSVESVLAGHDGRVYSVKWSKDGKQLLTASMDKTMLIWEEEHGIWLEKVRVGETGGNTLGFLGAVWGEEDNQILGYSWGGALHFWAEGQKEWGAQVIGGGHQQGVVDISWERNGKYLLSVSKDQTGRVHSLWKTKGVWQEVARPQVHGYDMSCCTMLDDHKYVSGAEEKVLRAFSAPSNFLENLNRISGMKVEIGTRLAQGASTPSLGLSNKAVFEGVEETPQTEKHVKDQFPDNYFTAEVHNEPPPEETLVQNTLWPEEHKLYGHGYELFCVASSPDSNLVASACKSTDPESSKVIVWSTRDWTQVGSVSGHSLTVTQLAFSPNNCMLLCVSRDRTWSLHSVNLESKILTTELLGKTDKKTAIHSRLIWSCAWTHDSRYFATASRDKKVVMWGNDEGSWKQVGDVLTVSDSATAVAIAGRSHKDFYVAAVGLECGTFHIYLWDKTWREIGTVSSMTNGHHCQITRLAFQPCEERLLLASCSSDTSVRITNVESFL